MKTENDNQYTRQEQPVLFVIRPSRGQPSQQGESSQDVSKEKDETARNLGTGELQDTWELQIR